jgi:hypothetical protein
MSRIRLGGRTKREVRLMHVAGHIRDRFERTLESYCRREATKEELLAACKGLHNCTDVIPSSYHGELETVIGDDWRNACTYGTAARKIKAALQ